MFEDNSKITVVAASIGLLTVGVCGLRSCSKVDTGEAGV
jgi:hypothetical protein